MALSVGLTGSIGSGKSTVLGHLGRLGAYTYEADVIAKDVMRRPEIVAVVADEFGADVLDASGQVDHQRLAAIVFQSEPRRRSLNAIVHPPVIEFIESEVDRLRTAGECAVAVFEVPLLVEADMLSLFDKIVVVAASPEAQLERLSARGYDQEGALARMRAQAPDRQRFRHADYILINKGAEDVLEEESGRLYAKLVSAAGVPG